jgi:hypothetical protein
MFWSKPNQTLEIDRKNQDRERLRAEADRIDAATKEENKAREAAAVAEYEAERDSWLATHKKELPFTVRGGMLVRNNQFVPLHSVDSFAWTPGYGPIVDFRMLRFEVRAVVMADDGTFETASHMSLAWDRRPSAYLREVAYRYYPHNAVLTVTTRGGATMQISCPEYQREWVHERFLKIIAKRRSAA